MINRVWTNIPYLLQFFISTMCWLFWQTPNRWFGFPEFISFFWLFHQGDAYQKAVHLLRSKVGCAETLWAFWSFVGKEWVNWVSWGALGDLIMCLDCCLFVSDARPFTPDVALLMEHFQLAVKALELQLLGGEQEVKVTQWNFFQNLGCCTSLREKKQ